METYNRDRHVKGVERYDSKSKLDGRDFTFGLAFGLLVGVVGLFIAPKSGDSLRDDIRKSRTLLQVTDSGFSLRENRWKVSDVNRWLKTKS